MDGVKVESAAVRGFLFFLLFALLVVPFACFLHFFPLANLPSHLLSVAAVVLGWVSFFLFKGRVFFLPRLSLFVLLFFGVLFLVAVLGGVSGADLRVLIVFGLVLFLAAQLAVWIAGSASNYYESVAFVVFVGGVIQAVAAIDLHYGLLDGSLGRWVVPAGARMTGLLSQFNLLGLYVFCAYLSVGYLYLKGRVSLGFLGFIAIFFGFVLAATGSRAILVYFSISFLGLIWLFWGSRYWVFGLFFGFLLLVAGGAFYWLVDGVVQPVLYDLGYVHRPAIGDFSRDYGTVGFRPSEWHKSLIMLLENPLLGVGFGNYGVQSFWMGVEYPWGITEGTFPTHSHNFFTQVGAEFGSIGLLSSFFLFFYVAKVVFSSKKTPEWWLVFSVCGVFFVNGMIEYALWDLHFAVLLVFFLAPFCPGGISFCLSRSMVGVISLGVVFVWAAVSWGSLDIYRKSIKYNYGVNDTLEVLDLSVASEDAFWGREMSMLLMMNTMPSPATLEAQDELTSKMMRWRPVNLAVSRRLQVAALKGDFAELAVLAKAMVNFYPKDVRAVRELLLAQDGIKGTRAAGFLERNLVLK